MFQLLGVGQVEISTKGEIPRRPRAAAEIRVTRRDVVASARAITQVPHQQLATEIELLLYRVGEFGMNHSGVDVFVVLTQQ